MRVEDIVGCTVAVAFSLTVAALGSPAIGYFVEGLIKLQAMGGI